MINDLRSSMDSIKRKKFVLNHLKVTKKIPSTATRWIKHGDHKEVRHTTHDEIKACVGTLALSSRCIDKNHNATIEEVGVIITVYGKLFVLPGDWIVEDSHGGIEICPEALFDVTYTYESIK